ncbi:spore germination protein [Fuchsiella alkaliacetigena]|uniref:spore germination protein n=1 Tax=Fuchsiella alkaliacetigena TaxID=957042 RepID=UPI002009EE33|nr:spore germination protein [Fuchsiella alkaliacetigena]MCK8824227.1 spore germination protein [Fuchsiella alkaliacetigena]
MFRKLAGIYNYLKHKSQDYFQSEQPQEEESEQEKVPRDIQKVKQKLAETFADCSDFVLRELKIGDDSQFKVILAYFEGLTDHEIINNGILDPLMIESKKIGIDRRHEGELIQKIKEEIINVGEVGEADTFTRTVEELLAGGTVLYIDGQGTALKFDTTAWEERGVEEPQTESIVRGPREGFVESLSTNISLLRRRIKNANLKFKVLNLGVQTNTDVAIGYLAGIVNEDVLKMVEERVQRIKIDAVLESGYIEEFIEDSPFSIFPTVGSSERPDKVAGKLLEGRVAILCEGTPFVLTVPYLFIEAFQSSEDYYNRPYVATIGRSLRFLALIITAALPAFYVAVLTFHQNILPFELLLNITAAVEGIPFSPFFETLVLGTAFELLREAGVRMPKPIGQAVSIVGALILGEAAVEAGIASHPIVIVTAVTAITSFILSPLLEPLIFIRLFLLVAANTLGFMGMGLVIITIFVHLVNLKSFGVPYLAPFSPLSGMDLEDTLVRFPLWAMLTRPRILAWREEEGEKYRLDANLIKKEE